MNVDRRTSKLRSSVLRGSGAVAALLVLSAVAWVPAASAVSVSANVAIIATGTGSEDHGTANVLDPGDELSPTDDHVRTLDATRVALSYTPDTSPGGSTNLVLTATISTSHAGWDLRGTNFASGNNPPCPGGVVTPQRNVLVCTVGNVASNSPITFSPLMRISAAAGDGFAFHVDVSVSDSNSTATASTPGIFSSAAPRFDLEKTIGDPQQTATSYVNEGIFALKVADPDPLGISALTDPVTFVDHVDQNSRVSRCDDTTPVTFTSPMTDPDHQYMEIVGTCNGAGFSATPNTGLANGQSFTVSMANVDWDRIYPPPTVGNGISDANSGWVIASMQYYLETDKADVEAADGNLTNGCETDLLRDPAHCGSCTGLCKVAHATAACGPGGSCIVGKCDTGWRKCSRSCVSNYDPTACQSPANSGEAELRANTESPAISSSECSCAQRRLEADGGGCS